MLVSPMLICVGCTNSATDNTEQTSEFDTEDAATSGTSLEDFLFVLTENGYKKTQEGYKASEFSKDVSSERLVSAKGNHLNVSLHYNYPKDRNREMKTFYKQQDEAVNIMVSSFLTRVANAAESEEGTMHYEIYVADELVREGDMDIAEAREFQALDME